MGTSVYVLNNVNPGPPVNPIRSGTGSIRARLSHDPLTAQNGTVINEDMKTAIQMLKEGLCAAETTADELRAAIRRLEGARDVAPVATPVTAIQRTAKRGAKPGRRASEETRARMRAAHAARKAARLAAQVPAAAE